MFDMLVYTQSKTILNISFFNYYSFFHPYSIKLRNKCGIVIILRKKSIKKQKTFKKLVYGLGYIFTYYLLYKNKIYIYKKIHLYVFYF